MIRWLIGCLIVILVGLCILLTQCITVTFIVVDDAITEYHRSNLLILYDVK